MRENEEKKKRKRRHDEERSGTKDDKEMREGAGDRSRRRSRLGS
jgi:hypothetical protein